VLALADHLSFAIKRVRQGIGMEYPLRYFFVRVHTDAQLDDRADLFASAIRGAYPDAYRTARRVREILELRLGQPVTEDETVYLTMHVARLAQASRPRRPDAKE